MAIAQTERHYRAKRALFSQIKLFSGADRGIISYQTGIDEHVAAGKHHHRKAHYPTADERWQFLTVHAGQRAGKTLIGAAEALYQLSPPSMLQQPGRDFVPTQGWIVAPNYGLTDRSFDYLWEWVVRQECFGPVDKVVRHKSRTRENRHIEMDWGSFAHGKSGEAPDSLVGAQLDWIVDDEAARTARAIWDENLNPRLANRKGWCLFSSTPRGYNWFQEFAMRSQTPSGRAAGWRDLNFHTTDNIYIDPQWVAEQMALVSENVRAQEWRGEFVSFSGLVYPDFRKALYDPDSPRDSGHLVDPNGWLPFSLSDAMWVRGIDIGITNPTGCLWLAVGPSNDVVVVAEYEEVRPTHDQHARNIITQERWPIAIDVISHEARTPGQTEQSMGVSPLDVYRQNGIYAVQGPKEWGGIVSIISKYLAATLHANPSHPRIFVSTECPKTIGQFLSYVKAERKSIRVELNKLEQPRKFNDHLMDALRLGLGIRPHYERQWVRRATQADNDPIRRYGYQGTTYAAQVAKANARRRGIGAAGRRGAGRGIVRHNYGGPRAASRRVN